jgi:hydrogenase nickel incorporation protein HypA/HybF
MHELSIATNVVRIASDCAVEAGAVRVTAVNLSIGALTSVHEETLRFGFDLVTQGTLLAGAELRVRQVPLAIYCRTCAAIVDLDSIQLLQCPVCGAPSGDIRRGQELDVDSIEIDGD